MTSLNSFGAAGELRAGGRTYQIYRLAALEKTGVNLSRIPYSIKILLENLLRFEDGSTVKKSDIEYVAKWDTEGPCDARSISARRASCCRISPACHAWSISPPCATRSRKWAPIRRRPTRSFRSIWSSITRCRWMNSAPTARSQLTRCWNFSAISERYAFLRWGQTAFREFPRGAAGYRHRASGESGISRAGRLDHGRRRLSRYAWSAPTRTPP